MAFHFPLGALLRLRQSLERQRAIALQKANLRLSQAKQKLDELEDSLRNSHAENAAALTHGRRSAEMQFALAVRENASLRRLALGVEIRELELSRQKVLAEYQKALRDREALELLQERARNNYQREEDRRRQQQMDEAFLLQRWRSGNL